jgi:hypothetical protein
MISKIVLCAFPTRLTAGLWRMGRLVSCEVFQNDEDGLNAFRTFLQRHKGVQISLIADAVEEDYRVETAPHTSGKAREVLLERKLGQLYRTTQYRAAQFIGRERENRRDDIFLLVALSNAESIQPWILAIGEQRAPLAGVHLLPMVSQYLISRLKLGAPHLLLMDGQVSGLRQTYFHNGQLRVSRLAADVSSTNGDHTQLYLDETEKTRLYLLSQRLIAPDTKLSLLILVNGEAGEEICRNIGNKLDVECLALASEKLASHIGVDAQALHNFPELLYMQTVVRGGVPVNLAPEAQIRDYQVRRMRRWLGYAATATLLGGLLVSALNFSDTLSAQSELVQAKAQTTEFEQRYLDVARNFPATPLPGGDLKIVVDLFETLNANKHTPQRLMLAVSNALESSPEIQLQRLHWKYTDDLNAKDDAGPVQQGGTHANASAPGGAPGVLHEIGFVDGEIRNFNGDYRAALDSVNRLVERIQKDARVESVVVVQQPVNVSAYSSLQGSTLDSQAQQVPAALFKLKLVLKPVTPP